MSLSSFSRPALIELQEASEKEIILKEIDEFTETSRDPKEDKQRFQINERLRGILLKEPFFPDNAWLVARFVHLTESTVLSQKDKTASSGYRQTYKPGDMVLTPQGSFLYGDEKIEKEIPYDYEIDVFPVTYGQYKHFIDSDPDFKIPKDWNKDKIFPENKKNHPVVNISFNDIQAYCDWRTKKENGIYVYRLPDEKEWEKAARGTDGRKYPWGDEFDKNKCNTEESGIRETTPVDQYPEGVSPFGCYDMVGNVWEWTSSDYEKGSKGKVLRGGSWSYNQGLARCAGRYRNDPDLRYSVVGFRCVRTLK